MIMKSVAYFTIICLVIKAVDAGPRECHACAERDAATCSANQISQTCATDRNSLGTTHCASAVGKYRDQFGKVHDGFIRGCIDCADNHAACFALGGALKAREFWILLECEMKCCTGDYCNTQALTLSSDAYSVFKDEDGPKECHACAERDEATCTANQQSQTCATDRNSLGTSHCTSAVGKYRDENGNV
ncbi:putative skeletal organic matrix protein 2 [Oculina patagonica]